MSKGKGIPVYRDKIKRKFADSASEQMEVTDWHPSNNPSMHLWRCFEALKDIANLLHGTAILNGEQERRRRIKILVTPLYSLCVSIRDLYNYLSSSSDLKKQFGKKQRAEINKLLNEFLAAVPLDKTSPIRGVRDQLSAHIDKLMPYEAKGIFGLAQTYEIGTWLHQCIITLSEVLSFEVFAWTTDDCPEGYVRFMNVEPWLVTFKLENGRPVALDGLHLTESPLKLIVKTCEEIILSSQWMFRPEDPRIISLQEGSTDKKKPV